MDLVVKGDKFFEDEVSLCTKACATLGRVSNRKFLLTFETSNRMKKSDFSIRRDEKSKIKSYTVRIREDANIEKVMPQIFAWLFRRWFGSSQNLKRNLRTYESYVNRLRGMLRI
jgi:hypothetical protein